MIRTGRMFKVEGEFVERLQHCDDPNDEDWQPFETSDLHPTGADTITVWAHDGEVLEDLINRAAVVVDWMRDEKGWEGFDAEMILVGADEETKVFRWEIH